VVLQDLFEKPNRVIRIIGGIFGFVIDGLLMKVELTRWLTCEPVLMGEYKVVVEVSLDFGVVL